MIVVTEYIIIKKRAIQRCMYSGTVDITKGQWAGKIFLLRFRYIEVLFHIFNYC